MVAAECFIARDIAVESEVDGVLVQGRKVIRLTERVVRQFPVARNVIVVSISHDKIIEFPRRQFFGKFGCKQLIDIDDAIWVRMNKQQPVLLYGGKPNETVT